MTSPPGGSSGGSCGERDAVLALADQLEREAAALSKLQGVSNLVRVLARRQATEKRSCARRLRQAITRAQRGG